MLEPMGAETPEWAEYNQISTREEFICMNCGRGFVVKGAYTLTSAIYEDGNDIEEAY